MRSSTTLLVLVLAASICGCDGGSSKATPMSQDLAEIGAIADDIQANGPQEVRALPKEIITRSVESFVFGRRTGAISEATLARLGGVERASILLIQAELIGAGGGGGR